MRVRATQRGFYVQLREPGDKFTLRRGEKDFSPRWMEKVVGEESPASDGSVVEPAPAVVEVVRPRRGRPPKPREPVAPPPVEGGPDQPEAA